MLSSFKSTLNEFVMQQALEINVKCIEIPVLIIELPNP